MRYGVIADIHANLGALEISLKTLRGLGIDALLCLGDLVGYGPQPNEVVATLAELGVPCVLGNHDEAAATGQGLDRMSELGRRTMRWTQDAIADDVRAFLSTLPVNRKVEGEVLLAHGSWTDPWTYVRRRDDAHAQLRRIEQLGDVLLVGHTHRQLAITLDRGAAATSEGILARARRSTDLLAPLLVNPGAVGQSRELRRVARFALLDLEGRSVRLFARAYPHSETATALAAVGLPPNACHMRPSLKKALRQAVRDREDRRLPADND